VDGGVRATRITGWGELAASYGLPCGSARSRALRCAQTGECRRWGASSDLTLPSRHGRLAQPNWFTVAKFLEVPATSSLFGARCLRDSAIASMRTGRRANACAVTFAYAIHVVTEVVTEAPETDGLPQVAPDIDPACDLRKRRDSRQPRATPRTPIFGVQIPPSRPAKSAAGDDVSRSRPPPYEATATRRG
jgi:hypothetical protein